MVKATSKGRTDNQKIVWIAVGIFAISGILPWFTVDFPIGTLKISVLDIGKYFSNPEVQIDFFSKIVYGILLSGWIFAFGFLLATAVFQRAKLLFVSATLITVSSIIWSIIVPYLRVQIIFLSLANNQQIGTQQSIGSGEIASMIAGFVMVYSYIKFKL